MGLVMQEPTLFNYSIKDNILYGKQQARNEEILSACGIANARHFIENDLDIEIDDRPEGLLAALQGDAYKEKVIKLTS